MTMLCIPSVYPYSLLPNGNQYLLRKFHNSYILPQPNNINPKTSKTEEPNLKFFIMNSSSSIVVINPLFCVPHPMDLAFTTKPPGEKKRSQLAALDASGNILFRAKKSSWKSFTQLQDASGHTILSMKLKFRSLHDRWQVFTGESTEAKDLVFSIKRSSAIQFHDKWLVFLAANTKEENCDFKIVGSYSEKNYTIYKGDSSFIVAQLTKEHKLNLPLNRHAFGATISANCDYSFVMALISIFDMVDRNKATMGSSVIAGSIAGAIS